MNSPFEPVEMISHIHTRILIPHRIFIILHTHTHMFIYYIYTHILSDTDTALLMMMMIMMMISRICRVFWIEVNGVTVYKVRSGI